MAARSIGERAEGRSRIAFDKVANERVGIAGFNFVRLESSGGEVPEVAGDALRAYRDEL